MFEVGDLVVKVLDDNRGGLKREYVREILMSFPTLYILVGADHGQIWTNAIKVNLAEIWKHHKKTLVSLI